MRVAKIVGGVILILSIAFGVFYLLWFFGFLPIDPELAVKIPVLVIVMGACFVAAWIGYVMITAPVPTSS
ncbi:MAG: dolichol phosphate-mannose biosynthesis regulatory protein [Aigarchaeota archaeon]|nr:dolichol phosphate-mannose biosynthesis regulatory protein [Aigarchaeota archaeon]MCX8193565.1 dolichol phosphate-mannose biosynthesis regulatory protein [Nitrososphaeria archaeon]MDW7986705.1 hypothetical protein [Nitrososphaerota archaeon]